jgi:hypothetical protein
MQKKKKCIKSQPFPHFIVVDFPISHQMYKSGAEKIDGGISWNDNATSKLTRHVISTALPSAKWISLWPFRQIWSVESTCLVELDQYEFVQWLTFIYTSSHLGDTQENWFLPQDSRLPLYISWNGFSWFLIGVSLTMLFERHSFRLEKEKSDTVILIICLVNSFNPSVVSRWHHLDAFSRENIWR